MKLNPSEKNAIDALEYVLGNLRMKVTSRTLREKLYLHPDFPSMASFSDVLKEWNIPHMATKIPAERLEDIPVPAVAFLDIEGGKYAPVRTVSQEVGVEWLDTKKGWQKEPLSSFRQKWSGVVLLIEPGEHSGEKNYKRSRKIAVRERAKSLFTVMALLLMLLFSLWLSRNVFAEAPMNLLLLLPLKIMGTALTAGLLSQSVSRNNPFLRKLCDMSNGNHCNSILDSDAARLLWGWLSWAEVGFVYFAGGVLTVLLAGITGITTVFPWLVLLTMLTAPFILYSLYYQKLVAGQWCRLCLGVLVLLGTEMVLCLPSVTMLPPVLDANTAALGGISFLFPAWLWSIVKTPLGRAERMYPLLRELYKVKLNPDYVTGLFSKAAEMPPVFSEMRTVTLGNPLAEHTLTVVTNPLCGPCARLHTELEWLLEETGNIRCDLVFIGPPEAQEIALTFLSLPEVKTVEAVHTWYANNRQNKVAWLGYWKEHRHYDDASVQLQLHYRWSQIAGVTGTPTVYLDGVHLPSSITIRDLNELLPLLPDRKHNEQKGKRLVSSLNTGFDQIT